MSDEKTPADEKADALNKPMESPEVDVDAYPVQRDLPKKRDPKRKPAEKENEINRDVGRKVEKNVKKVVKEAVKKASEKPGATRQDQYDAAKDAAEKESRAIPRQRVKEFSVTVGDEHDDSFSVHEPKEGAPPAPKSDDSDD